MRDKSSYSDAGKLGGLAAAKTASIRKNSRIDKYNQNAKQCKHCQKIITYDKRANDFCSQSCGATYNNFVRGGTSHIVLDNCLWCTMKLIEKGQHKYCSKQCMTNFWWSETKKELLLTGVDNSSNNLIGKKYLIELCENKCQSCNLSEWLGVTIPLVLDHIDGNSYNNKLSNLRVICNNCDSISPTFKGRNKGNGRFERAKRYKLEKEIMNDIKADVVQ
jgi:endogenous inhibitor of DNA gyrase (YacG/DUF329 family)